MENVLIVSSSDKGGEAFASLITERCEARVCFAKSSKEGIQTLKEQNLALIVIVAPLPDEYGTHLARQAAESAAGVIFVARDANRGAVSEQLRRQGIFVFSLEMGRSMFGYAVDIMLALHFRLMLAAPRTERLQQQIQDIRAIDRAKCLLIQYADMTEQEAHRDIEKQAMDWRRTRREVADEILKSYDV